MNKTTTDDRLVDVFRNLEERPDYLIKNIEKKIAIISTPRCGSSMFCDVLYNTGNYGNPKEWFNPLYFSIYCRLFNQKTFDFQNYLDFILNKTTSLNGIFAANFHVDQYQNLLRNHRIDLFKLDFDRVYYLSRRDKLGQALSLTKAIITDQWRFDSKEVKEPPKALTKSQVFDKLLFISKLEEFYESNMKKYVDAEYVYEDFINLDQTHVFEKVMSECGASNQAFKWSTTIQKQSGDKSLEELRALKIYLGC